MSDEIIKYDATEENKDLPCLRLVVDPGSAPTELIAEILADFSELYKRKGGPGINWEVGKVDLEDLSNVPARPFNKYLEKKLKNPVFKAEYEKAKVEAEAEIEAAKKAEEGTS